MKSIQNQYNDLKEGKMSQANFMRNLRMTMPQYVTNITSFQDSVRILKNKGIITESMAKANYEDPITLAKAIATTHPELQRFALEDRNMFQRAAFKYAAELMKSAGLSNTVQMNLINGYADEDWPSDFISALGDALESGAISENNNPEEEIVDEMNMEIKPEESNNDAEFDAILKQLEDEMAGEIAVKSDVLDEPLEEELNEGKGKELHPNLIHPGELRMGIRVELEHTDDLNKAKKIALDHIAENPYYYTALKLAGIESPSAPKVKAPKEVKEKKKKDVAELVDKANQMQKVKMPKTVKEAMEVDPAGNLKPQLPTSADTERLLKYLKNNTTFVSMLKNIDNVTELSQLYRELLQLTDPELQSLSDTQLQSIFRKAVLDFRKEAGVPNQIFSKNANIQKGINDIGGIKEAEQPTEDKIEMELASALSQQPTLKRILQKVDLPTEVDGTVKALLDRTNLKNIPDQIILAALRKVLNDQPGPTFTAQYAANANIGGPNPKIGKTLEEKLRSIVREILSEEAPSKKNAASEITAKAVDYIDDYNEGESKEYKKSQLENVFDSYEDKVGRRFDDSVFEDVIDMLKAKGYTMTMKETFDGRDNLTNISDDTQE
jgi:hypothetical protein